MSDSGGPSALRSLGIAAGLLALGAAAGVLTERAVVAKQGRPDRESDEPYGRLRGTPVEVLDSSGRRLYVEVEECTRENPENLTLVFTHGYALNQDCWHYQRRDLRALGRMVFWDHRSHGRSHRALAETNTLEQAGEDLHTVIRTVVPDGPIILVGHSMGGMTIMELALTQPRLFAERVRGIALLSTSPGGLDKVPFGLPAITTKPVQRALPVGAAVLMRNASLVEQGRSRVNDLSLLFTRFYSFGSSAPPSMADFTHRMLGETPIDVVGEFLPALLHHERRAALRTIAPIPSLVMVGEKDRMTPLSHSIEMARELPLAELEVMPDAGHMMILEHYEQVNHQLRTLVARVRADLVRDARRKARSRRA